MAYLENIWYQAGWETEVPLGEKLVRTILDQPILFFRRTDGTVAALLDRCPHRFAPLSAGSREGDSVICGYHGLGFGADGRCDKNPHGAITSAMKVRSYPVAEKHSAIWVWMGDPEAADEAEVPDLSFIDDTPMTARLYWTLYANANYQLLTDNILDVTHIDFLHPTTLGGGCMDNVVMKVRDDGEALVADWISLNVEPPPGYKALVNNAPRADIWIGVTWNAPAVLVLGTSATLPGTERTSAEEAYILHSMTPETDMTSHYFVCGTRPYLQDDVGFTDYLREVTRQAFIDEDKPMIEKQQDRMATPDLWALEPILLRQDEAAVRARRKLEKRIAKEQLNRSQGAGAAVG